MKKYSKNVPLIALLLGLIASAMIFLPALKYPDVDTTYTGIQVATGVTIFNLGPIADGKIPFNFLALLAFVLPAIAGLVMFTTPKNALLSIIFFIAAAVLLFILPTYIVINVTAFGGSGVTDIDIDWVLQIGAIVAGSLSVLGAVLVLLGMNKK